MRAVNGKRQSMIRIGMAAAIMAFLAMAPVARAQSGEAMAWTRAVASCDGLRAYLKDYPSGRFVAQARTQLASRNCPDPEAARREAERAAEAAARRQRDLEAQLAQERAAREAAERRAETVRNQPAPAPVSNRDNGPFGLDLLHPTVRAAVVEARSAAQRGEAAAGRARDAAARAEDAANRARRGEAGFRLYDAGDGRVVAAGWNGQSWNGYGVMDVSAPQPGAGDRYAGAYLGGVKSGPGIYLFARNAQNSANSLRYEGEWANDNRNGVGVYVWRDGMRHAGGQSNSQLSGPGVFSFTNGNRQEGEYANGVRNGPGVLWGPDGRLISSGIWRDDVLVTPLGAQGSR